jgi:HK97 family phage portal protein
VRLFGLEITRRKAVPTGAQVVSESRGGWWRLITEPFGGAFQRDIEWTVDSVLAHTTVWTCITLIASDIGKLRPKLVQKDVNGIWQETDSASFSPVLRKPNRFQNHIQFKEWWITSKLIRGNAYALKERDQRKVVVALYLLDPTRVQVLVAPDGAVFYQLNNDNLSGIEEQSITVPASEIIHDRMNCLFHPLVGVSPLFASGSVANIGLTIQRNSDNFFAQGSNPGGILTAPATIDQATADRLKDEWNSKFSGNNAGKVAVLGDGLKFEPMRMTAVDSQLIAQLKLTAQMICSAFHVPAFKAGVGDMPAYQNAEILDGIYYSDCLQYHIESFELAMDEGLGLTAVTGKTLGVELDLDGLLRMDTATQIKTLAEGVAGAIYTPDEARAKVDLPPLKGGDTIYMQQQNYSLEALAKRDARADPFATATPTPPPASIAPTPDKDEPDAVTEAEARAFFDSRLIQKAAA